LKLRDIKWKIITKNNKNYYEVNALKKENSLDVTWLLIDE